MERRGLCSRQMRHLLKEDVKSKEKICNLIVINLQFQQNLFLHLLGEKHVMLEYVLPSIFAAWHLISCLALTVPTTRVYSNTPGCKLLALLPPPLINQGLHLPSGPWPLDFGVDKQLLCSTDPTGSQDFHLFIYSFCCPNGL